MSNLTHEITVIITDHDPIAWNAEVQSFTKGKEIKEIHKGVTAVPMEINGARGVVSFPYALIIYRVSEEDYNSHLFKERMLGNG